MSDKRTALMEMYRVLKPAGRLVLSTWCAIEDNPYFHALVEAVTRHLGFATAAGLKSAFSLSRAEELHSFLTTVGFGQIETNVIQLDLSLPELSDFVPKHISATPMAMSFIQSLPIVQEQTVESVVEAVGTYLTDDHVQIPFRSYMLSGQIA